MKIKRVIKNLSVAFAVGFILSGCATTDAGEIALPVVQPNTETAIEKPKQTEKDLVPVVRLTAYMFCSPANHVVQNLTEVYGENPILSFHAQIPGFPITGPLPTLLFASPKTGSVSLIVFVNLTNKETSQDEKFACATMLGNRIMFSDEMKKRNYGPSIDSVPSKQGLSAPGGIRIKM